MSKKPKRPSVESKIAAEIYEKVRRLYPGGEGFDVSWIEKRIRSVVRRGVRDGYVAGFRDCEDNEDYMAKKLKAKYGVTP